MSLSSRGGDPGRPVASSCLRRSGGRLSYSIHFKFFLVLILIQFDLLFSFSLFIIFHFYFLLYFRLLFPLSITHYPFHFISIFHFYLIILIYFLLPLLFCFVLLNLICFLLPFIVLRMKGDGLCCLPCIFLIILGLFSMIFSIIVFIFSSTSYSNILCLPTHPYTLHILVCILRIFPPSHSFRHHIPPISVTSSNPPITSSSVVSSLALDLATSLSRRLFSMVL